MKNAVILNEFSGRTIVQKKFDAYKSRLMNKK